MQNRTAINVAAYLLWLAEQAGDTLVTPMKIQKLAYYAEAFSLAWRRRSLFTDPIESWQHGPVVPALYDAYKQYGGQPIPGPFPMPEGFDAGDVQVMKSVSLTFGRRDAKTLSQWTHEEAPWKMTRNAQAGPTRDALRHYFSLQHHPSCQEAQDHLFAKLATQYMLGMIGVADVARWMGTGWSEASVRAAFKQQGIMRQVPQPRFNVLASVQKSLERYAATWKDLAQR